MNIELLEILRCPKSGQKLDIEGKNCLKNIEAGTLVTGDTNYSYEIINNIPRFVHKNNYADNFGIQWNLFKKTQLDSFSGHPISKERFWKSTGWEPEELKEKWVLDAGCGAGRFAEIALDAGAKVIAIDYSNSVDACYANLKGHHNLHLVQADIFSLPFAKESFHFIYSLGVLQHTPDVIKAFSALPLFLSSRGKICADFYWKHIKAMLHLKYLLRPITKRIDPEKLFKILQKTTPAMLTVSQFYSKIPILGKILQRTLPVANYTGRLPLSKKQMLEWALLDTFDMLSPQFDNPVTFSQVFKMFIDSGLSNVNVKYEIGMNGPTGTGEKL